MMVSNVQSAPEPTLTVVGTTRSTVKRDGHTLQPFDVSKIRQAVSRAWGECREIVDERALSKVVNTVVSALTEDTVDVERVQDAVETALMRHNHFDVAKAFILFRHQRSEARTIRTPKTPDPKAISDYIHAGKYARYVSSKKRREVFSETVARIEDMHIGVYPELESDIRWAFDRVREKRVLPSMRSMQFGGKAILANANRIFNCMGVETDFITTQGVKKFSDFKHGDTVTVLTHTGSWKTAVVKSYGTQQLFEVTISRGRSSHKVRATRDHQWLLENGDRTHDLSVKHKLAKAPRLVGAWDYNDVNPEARYYWALGYVYGDGTLVKGRDGEYHYSMVRLCGADKERFLERFKELGFAVSAPASFGGDAIAYTGKYLKTLPSIEKDGFENVMAFVRGYLDADGHKNESGHWPSPFNGIQATGGEAIDFIRSVFPAVGAYITREEDLTGQETNFGVRPETSRFGLVLGFGDSPASPYSVQEIKEAGYETVWCLEVEDDHSFVLPNGIVTGNCSFSLIDRPEVFAEALFLLLSGCGVGYSVQFDHIEKLPVIGYVNLRLIRHHVVEDTIEGWADAVKALVQSYLDGVNLELAYHLIRDAGTPLRTSGGRAPGHLRLKESLERIRGVLSGAQGRKLRPVECHRIMCHAADAVLSGGIRRSAMICLFSLDDSEMMHVKTGDWYSKEPWLANSNNSVVLKRDEVRKKQFKRIFGMTRQWGEPGFYFTDDYDYGTNPSMPAGTLVGTREGIFPIEQLEGRHFEVKSLDGTFAKAKCWMSSEQADVLEIGFGPNLVTHSTKEHRWPVKDGDTIVKKYASELRPGDLIPLNRNEPTGMNGDLTLTRDEGFMVGYIFGDGQITRRAAGTYTMGVSVSEGKLALGEKVLRLINERKKEPSNLSRRDREGGGVEFSLQTSDQAFITTLMTRYGMSHDKSAGIPSKVWTSNDDFIRGFIDGLLSTDGCVSVADKRLTFTTAHPTVATDFAKLLSFYGVPCSLQVKEATSTFPNGVDYGRTYTRCDVRLGLPALPAFAKMFDLSHTSKQENLMRLVDEAGQSRQANANAIKAGFAEVRWIKPVEAQRVWDISVQHDQHVFPSQYAYTGNCCEIGLNAKLTVDDELQKKLALKGYSAAIGQSLTGWAFCNLCEINAAKLTSLQDFQEAAKAAAIIGTLQAGYTKMPYLGAVSEVIAERESLLGIGMTGMLDAPHIACNPEFQRTVAGKIKAWNAEYAAKIGINPAARTTCVKPSGCRPWDALTSTDKGILTLEEMFGHHPNGEPWAPQPEGISVLQGGATSPVVRTFDNGEAEVLEIEMNYGLTVRSTPNHPWFVQYRHSHEGASKRTDVNDWIPANRLAPGDVLEVKSGVYSNETPWKFTNVNVRALTMRSATKVILQPDVMDDDLAWLVGYIWGDGAQSVTKYRLRFTDGNRVVIAKARRILREKFGLEAEIRELTDRDAASLEVGSKHLWLWMTRNGIEKYSEGETLERIPRCVRSSSWRHLVSFAAGLLDSDGCLNRTKTGVRPQVSTSSDDFARHFQQVMWAVGLGFGRSLQTQGDSFQEIRHLYHLSLSASPTTRPAFDHLVAQSVKCRVFIDGPDFSGWQMDNDTTRGRQIPGKVREVRSLGVMPTFDVEVGETHWFYDGAVRSHNTTSLELGCVASGHHAHHARRYIRRVTADELEYVFQAFRAVNPHMCVRKPDGKWVIEFPVVAPPGATVREDITAIPFLDMVKSTQQNWVVPGTADATYSPGLKHNVSNTVTVRPDEWEKVADYLWENRNSFTGVSLLASTGDKDYAFAPNEEILTPADEARWNAILNGYKPVDYTTLVEESDETDLAGEVACAGGVCMIV